MKTETKNTRVSPEKIIELLGSGIGLDEASEILLFLRSMARIAVNRYLQR